MDPEAPVTVLTGFLATCSAGAIFGGSYAVAKRQSPIVFAVNSAVNSGIVGLTFFALREYIAGPVLVHTMPWEVYIRRREKLRADASGQTVTVSSHPSLSEMRAHKILDTALAGSATGSIINVWKRGLPGAIPGAVTACLISTSAQFLWNELRIARIRFVSRSNRPIHPQPDILERPKTFSEKLIDGLGVILPVKKISDEEYLQKLLKEREEVERRLEMVDRELNATSTQERQQS